ncbi:MAG: hypothetical protein IKE30_02000, partial [Clostridia bacterium]|nr:hypothetical protein [Clostridia bacterium]
MKKPIALFLVAGMLFALSLCAEEAALAEESSDGRQVATAWLDQAYNEISVMVDLSGGWSVEFAHGALYLYDGDYSEDKDATAIGLTLEQEVFEEYCAEAASSESYREIEGAKYYMREDGTGAYLTTVGDDAYFLLFVNDVAEGDAVFERIKLKRYAPEESGAESVGMANPWTEVKTAEEAADGAGVGYFTVPEENTETTGGPVNWYGFQYMKGIAEADGAIGAAELTVRKGLKQDTEDVSGDCTEYALEWTVESDGW